VNTDGEVIGINAMIIQPRRGIGFAIPINLARSIMTELIKTGKVVRPWVGIGLQDRTEDLAKSFNLKDKKGALISQVYEGGPAEKAGLDAGDVIVEIDGKKVQNSQEVIREVLGKKVGEKVEFVVMREGKSSKAFVEDPLSIPLIPDWSRVTSAIPDFLERLKNAVDDDNA
jgi:serine protease Do